jgi:hypothetical protein
MTKNLPNYSPLEHCEQDAMVWIYMNLIDSWQKHDCDDLQPQGEELMKTLWTKSWFIHGGTPVTARLRLFLSNAAFEQRCLRYMRMSMDPWKLFET